MKYTKEERLDIGRQIYDGQISRCEAADRYDISDLTARDYMRMYRNVNRLPPKRGKKAITALSFESSQIGIEDLNAMTKEKLIQELVKARITEAR